MQPWWALACLLLAGCGPQGAQCPYGSTDAIAANAGCFIADARGVLMLEQRNGLLNFPGGTAEAGESPRCTAWRETWEEAGLQPQVGELADVMPNGFHLYYCRIPADSVPAPIDVAEVRRAHWVLPGSVAPERWRFPEQGARLAEWLQRAP